MGNQNQNPHVHHLAGWAKAQRPIQTCRQIASLVALIGWLFGLAARSQSQAVQPMSSRTGPDEFDTADNPGGQIGGMLLGFGYRLLALRCVSGQVIVGANIRRGDALDYLQITCAIPSCANGTCTWSSPQPGMSGGSSTWGDAHPAMLCQSNEIVSGVRGRVVAFTAPVAGRRTGFDYASDLEIECSQMTQAAVAGPSGHRFNPVTQGGSGTWHHPEGGFANASPGVAPNVVQTYITPPISCRARGYGASSISVGIANFLGESDHPVVQAVSLFCPIIAPPPPPPQTTPSCPTSLTVALVDNQSAAVQQIWFAPSLFSPGGRTAGGSVVTMLAQPASQNFNGTQITERVGLDRTVAQCPIPNPANLCTAGTGRPFTVGDPETQFSLSNNGLTVPWNPPGGQHQNSFPDGHFVFDPRLQPSDLLAQLPRPPAGGCTVTCRQTYTCGTGASAVTYSFQIVYSLVHATWRSTIVGIPNPFDQGKSVTLVTATKH